MTDCSSIQRSLAWCQGRPELPGVKRRIYYISKYDILQWPNLPHDANGRLTGSAYVGDFTLRADASWKFIDIIPDKSQLTSEPQGEYPSQTQLNKLVAVHPSVGADATAAAAYLNNNDNVFPVESMPTVLQWISAVIPPRYYIQAMRKLMIMGVSIQEVWHEVVVLIGMTALLLTVSLKKFKTRLG